MWRSTVESAPEERAKTPLFESTSRPGYGEPVAPSRRARLEQAMTEALARAAARKEFLDKAESAIGETTAAPAKAATPAPEAAAPPVVPGRTFPIPGSKLTTRTPVADPFAEPTETDLYAEAERRVKSKEAREAMLGKIRGIMGAAFGRKPQAESQTSDTTTTNGAR